MQQKTIRQLLRSLLPDWIGLGKEGRWEDNLGLYILHGAHWAILVATLLLLLTIAVWLCWMRMQQPSREQWSRLRVVFYFAINLGMFGLACAALYQPVRTASPTEAFFFFLRATEFRSGVSPLLPWFLIVLAACLSFFSIVRCLALAERLSGFSLNFATPMTSSFTSLGELEAQIKKRLVCPIFAVPGALWTGVLIAALYYHFFVSHYIWSIEGFWFDCFFIVAFYLVPLVLAWMFLRLCWLALGLRTLLKRLGWHPLFHASLDDQDAAFHRLPQINLMLSTPTYTALSSSVTLAQGFFRLLHTSTGNQDLSVKPNFDVSAIQSNVEDAERQLYDALKKEARGKWREALEARRKAQKLVSEASRTIAAWMEPHWTELDDQAATQQTLITQGRLFLISRVAAFLQYILAYLQHLAGLVTAGLLLLLLAATSYPFQPREPLLLFGWVSILLAVAVMILLFVQLSRDKVISLL